MNNDDNRGRAFLFLPSFADAISALPDDCQLEIYRALSRYGCCGEVPDNLSPVANAMFILMRSQLDSMPPPDEKPSRAGAPRGQCNNPAGRRGRPTEKTNQDQTQEQIETNPELIKTNQELIQEQIETNPELIKTNQELIQEQIETNPELIKTNQEQTPELINQAKEKETRKRKDKESFPPHPVYIETDKEKEYKEKEKTALAVNACARAREIFLKDFFDDSRRNAIHKQADNLGITVERYTSLVLQVLDDWEVNGPVPAPDSEYRSKMIYTVRKKHAAQSRQGPQKSTIVPRLVSSSTEEQRRERNAVYDRTDFLSGEALARKLAMFSPPGAAANQEQEVIAELRARVS